jgi:hypothetical protein
VSNREIAPTRFRMSNRRHYVPREPDAFGLEHVEGTTEGVN